MVRVLVIGAGCTGGAVALHLKEKLGQVVHVWEKARGAGGRYTTSRETVDGVELKADMGAQYSSVDTKDTESVALMQRIVDEGAAALVTEGELAESAERPPSWSQYRGIGGQNGIIKAMLSMAEAEVTYERRVSKIDVKGNSWIVTPFDAAPQSFDCVVMCVPGCGPGGDNLNKIHGNWERKLSDADWRSVEVPHDCRFSVALFLKAGCKKNLAKSFEDKVEKVVSDCQNVELLIWQSRKDGADPDGPQVVVLHTPQGAKGNKQAALPRMIKDGCGTLGIPTGAVQASKIITWYQSQVTTNQSRRNPCHVASAKPPLILAGDYFTSSTFTGCAQSAQAAASEAARLLGESGPVESSTVEPKAVKQAELRVNGATESRGSGGDKSSSKRSKCAECSYNGECILDKTDGNQYCKKCWKAYYGKLPSTGMGA